MSKYDKIFFKKCRLYRVDIFLHRNGYRASDEELLYSNDGFTLKHLGERQQYFNYRAALYQVANPKRYVELRIDSYEYVPKLEEKLYRAKCALTAKRGVITKVSKFMRDYRMQHNDLFLKVEEDPEYVRAKEKLEQNEELVRQLEELVEQLSLEKRVEEFL